MGADNRTFMLLFKNGDASFWEHNEDTNNYQNFITYRDGHHKPIQSAAWTTDQRYLATAAADGQIIIWDMVNAVPMATLYGHAGVDFDTIERADVLHVSWQDDRYLLSIGGDGSIRQWKILDESGHLLCQGVDLDGYPRCFDEEDPYLTFEESIIHTDWLDENRIWVATEDGTAWIWEPNHAAEITPIATTSFITGHHTLWLDGARMLMQNGSRVQLHHIFDGEPKEISLINASEKLMAAALDRELTLLVTSSVSGTVQLIDLNSAKPARLLPVPTESANRSSLTELRFSQDGKRLLGAGEQIVLWDLETDNILWATEYLGASEIAHAAVSPDNQLVAVTYKLEPFYSVFGVIDSESAAQVGQNIQLNRSNSAILWTNSSHREPIRGINWAVVPEWENQYRWYQVSGWFQRRRGLFYKPGAETARLVFGIGNGKAKLCVPTQPWAPMALMPFHGAGLVQTVRNC